jgi:hypothetical protein
MKIIKVGSFNENGSPIDWIIDEYDVVPESKFWAALEFDPDGKVLIGGVEMVELSNERRTKMGFAKGGFMKRPWTPGPWLHDDICFSVRNHPHIPIDRVIASKSPEMAEILIRLDNLCAYPPESRDEMIIEVYRLSGEAIALLASVGWEE